MRTVIFALLMLVIPAMVQAGQDVTYKVGNESFEGYSAKAKGKSKGLVLIIHDWDGLDEYEVKRAEMLAGMGYDAFAVDLYGKGNRPKDTGARKAETAKLYKDRNRMRTLILGGMDAARKISKGKTVVMGYCFGGAAVLELARSGKGKDIGGYVTFHGGLATPEGQSYPKDTAPILVAHGGADTSITMDHVAALSKELEATGITYEIQVYSGAPHAFTVFGGDRYQKRADEQSWAAFSGFLATNLGR